MSLPLVVAITGASGAVYAVRLLEVLRHAGVDVHLVISPSGAAVIKQELGIDIDLMRFTPSMLLPSASDSAADPKLAAVRQLSGVSSGDSSVLPVQSRPPGQIIYHFHSNFMAPIASGSFLTRGMVVCPCSGSTMSGIAHGSSTNLVQRAADVHLKEHRRLVLVPRETPLSSIQLENMRVAAQAGAVVLPAMPGWYHGVRSLQDLIDFVVARILDQIEVPHSLMQRWGEPTVPPGSSK